jgi:hypothetical protein
VLQCYFLTLFKKLTHMQDQNCKNSQMVSLCKTNAHYIVKLSMLFSNHVGTTEKKSQTFCIKLWDNFFFIISAKQNKTQKKKLKKVKCNWKIFPKGVALNESDPI